MTRKKTTLTAKERSLMAELIDGAASSITGTARKGIMSSLTKKWLVSNGAATTSGVNAYRHAPSMRVAPVWTDNKPVVIYARVSSESQEENTSLSTQLEKCRAYADIYGLAVVEVFQDVSSGGNTDRQGFLDMMGYVEAHPTFAVVVYKFDRLHRSLLNLLKQEEALKDMFCSLISVIEQIDTSTATGTMFFQIIGSFAEFERKAINKRMKDGKSDKIKGGLFTAGGVPFGYDLKDSDALTVNEADAAKVKAIFKARLAGKSLRDIAVDVLGEVGKYGQVKYILSNPAYTGKLRQENGKTVNVPPIITKQMFNKINRPE